MSCFFFYVARPKWFFCRLYFFTFQAYNLWCFCHFFSQQLRCTFRESFSWLRDEKVKKDRGVLIWFAGCLPLPHMRVGTGCARCDVATCGCACAPMFLCSRDALVYSVPFGAAVRLLTASSLEDYCGFKTSPHCLMYCYWNVLHSQRLFWGR